MQEFETLLCLFICLLKPNWSPREIRVILSLYLPSLVINFDFYVDISYFWVIFFILNSHTFRNYNSKEEMIVARKLMVFGQKYWPMCWITRWSDMVLAQSTTPSYCPPFQFQNIQYLYCFLPHLLKNAKFECMIIMHRTSYQILKFVVRRI